MEFVCCDPFGSQFASAQKSQITALFRLDFGAQPSVCGGERKPPLWKPAILDTVLLTHLILMRERLDQASALGQAAEACGSAGNIRKAIEIALDVEQLTYEVNTLTRRA
jgi:hypothetical protein